MQEDEKVAGWLRRDRSKAGGAESVDLLHVAILALSRPFCKLPAANGTVA